METEKEKTPMEKWRDNLKEGDLIRVIHYHHHHLAVFKAFRPGSGTYYGCRMHYYSIPDGTWRNNWYGERLAEWEKGKGKPYVCHINSRGEDRVVPVDINMLTPKAKNYYERLKKILT